MPINVVRGSSLEFVVELIDPSTGGPSTVLNAIFLTLAYTATSGSTASKAATLLSMGRYYVGYMTTPSDMTGTGVYSLALTSSGGFSVGGIKDPKLRVVG